MERRKEQNMNDLLRSFLADSNLETPLLQFRAVQNWKEVVPESVSALTEAMEIKGGCMFIKVLSPSLASELQMQRTEYIRKLNETVGACVVSDLKFVL